MKTERQLKSQSRNKSYLAHTDKPKRLFISKLPTIRDQITSSRHNELIDSHTKQIPNDKNCDTVCVSKGSILTYTSPKHKSNISSMRDSKNDSVFNINPMVSKVVVN